MRRQLAAIAVAIAFAVPVLAACTASATPGAPQRATCDYFNDGGSQGAGTGYALSAVPGHPPKNGTPVRLERSGAWLVCYGANLSLYLSSDQGMCVQSVGGIEEWEGCDGTNQNQAWSTSSYNQGQRYHNRGAGGVLCAQSGGVGAEVQTEPESICGTEHQTWTFNGLPGIHTNADLLGQRRGAFDLAA